jgi:hypothetical protein
VPAPAVRRRTAPDRGLALTRLLEIARLTPAQAVALGADVLSELHERHAAGTTRSGLRRETVRVAADGRAHLIDDDGPGDRRVPDADRTDLAAAAELLGDITAATRQSVAASGLQATGPLAALGRAATEARLPDGTVATVASILRDADATGGTEARAELARLVSAAGSGAVAPPRSGRPAPRSLAPRPRQRRRPRAVARAVAARTWKWILSLVVLVAVILIEIAFLRDEITRDIQAVLEAGGSGSEASTSTPALPPVVPPAPAAAGTVTAVDLRAVRPCTPDAGCEVRMQVVLQPRPEPQTVAWAFQVLDRCTGAAVTAPGGTVTVPPDGDRADAVSSVRLPPADALAVLALTSHPSTAASAPLLVPADGACQTHPAGQSG